MPELPEIETLRRGLAPELTGRRVSAVTVYERRLRRPVEETALERLVGRRLEAIGRRGKYLLFYWDSGEVLLVHLGMSGRLGLFESTAVFEPHTHVVFDIDDGRQLRFRDPRRFGSLELLDRDGMDTAAPLSHLGVEPLSPDFRTRYIRDNAGRSRRPLKQLLMDNRFVVGVGNIYANESLFLAGLDPMRPADSLNAAEIVRLCAAVVRVLKRAIRRGGTTLNDFRGAQGEPGFFQLDLKVYGRDGESCRRCGGEIVRLNAGGRGTFFCPGCQH